MKEERVYEMKVPVGEYKGKSFWIPVTCSLCKKVYHVSGFGSGCIEENCNFVPVDKACETVAPNSSCVYLKHGCSGCVVGSTAFSSKRLASALKLAKETIRNKKS